MSPKPALPEIDPDSGEFAVHSAPRVVPRDDVEGWLDDRSASVTRFLMAFQRANDITGDVLEIGVYHGKYFLVLMEGVADLEMGVAIDIFQTQAPVLESVQGTREVFEENIRKYAPDKQVVVMERDSTTLSGQDVLNAMACVQSKPFRFISIDGSHDAKDVQRDLTLAEALLMPGGIIALDDWVPDLNKQWPGVAAGEKKYQDATDGEKLGHIGAIPNKLLLCNHTFWLQEYQKVLRDYAKGLS